MFVEPDELRKTAAEFMTARTEYGTASKRMDDALSELKKNWGGVSQEAFYSEYEVLHQYMEAFGKLVETIARDMNELADEYEKADSWSVRKKGE